MTRREVRLPAGWLSPDAIEGVFNLLDDARAEGTEVDIVFGRNTALLATTGLRCLAYLNQWGSRIDEPRPFLVFENRDLFSFLDRNGFLACLDSRIACDPDRPVTPASIAMRGAASTVVEVVQIPPVQSAELQNGIVGEMTDKVLRAVTGLDAELLERMSNRLFSALAELIDNVQNHSQTTLSGYATLQVYAKSRTVQAVVGDSGVGIPATLRAGNAAVNAEATDEQLLQLSIEKGLSRRGTSHGFGCGFQVIRDLISQVGGIISVRVPTSEFILKASPGSRSPLHGRSFPRRAVLEGTHIGLELRLDSPGWRL